MTILEMLEFSAKAAGLIYTKPADGYDGSLGLEIGENPMRTRCWNPLSDNGDALWLMVKLNLMVSVEGNVVYAAQNPNGLSFDGSDIQEIFDDDPYAATRHAIVRVAAEIGKNTILSYWRI